MTRKLVSAAIIIAMAATNAHAAYLSDIQGAVLVNNQPVTSNVEVAPGDRVKAITGSVKVVYNNGTAVPVTAGETVVVLASDLSPSASYSESSKDSVIPDNSAYYIVGGGLVVAGGVGLGIWLSQSSKPASP